MGLCQILQEQVWAIVLRELDKTFRNQRWKGCKSCRVIRNCPNLHTIHKVTWIKLVIKTTLKCYTRRWKSICSKSLMRERSKPSMSNIWQLIKYWMKLLGNLINLSHNHNNHLRWKSRSLKQRHPPNFVIDPLCRWNLKMRSIIPIIRHAKVWNSFSWIKPLIRYWKAKSKSKTFSR